VSAEARSPIDVGVGVDVATPALDDDAFLRAFESCTLRPFRHRDHLRVAWLYLRAAPFEEAALRFVGGIKRFAAALGATTKYHETITWAYLALVAERMHDGRARSFDDFARGNADLFDHESGALSEMYDARTLDSERARVVFVLPRRG
jgi:hypothetical protein